MFLNRTLLILILLPSFLQLFTNKTTADCIGTRLFKSTDTSWAVFQATLEELIFTCREPWGFEPNTSPPPPSTALPHSDPPSLTSSLPSHRTEAVRLSERARERHKLSESWILHSCEEVSSVCVWTFIYFLLKFTFWDFL